MTAQEKRGKKPKQRTEAGGDNHDPGPSGRRPLLFPSAEPFLLPPENKGSDKEPAQVETGLTPLPAQGSGFGAAPTPHPSCLPPRGGGRDVEPAACPASPKHRRAARSDPAGQGGGRGGGEEEGGGGRKGRRRKGGGGGKIRAPTLAQVFPPPGSARSPQHPSRSGAARWAPAAVPPTFPPFPSPRSPPPLPRAAQPGGLLTGSASPAGAPPAPVPAGGAGGGGTPRGSRASPARTSLCGPQAKFWGQMGHARKIGSPRLGGAPQHLGLHPWCVKAV